MPDGPVSPSWRTARMPLRLDRPLVAGIVNVTPDSFWDGGRHGSVEAAVRHAGELLEEGADLLDIGGESTRPGAQAVSAEEETARVAPVVAEIVRRWPDVPVSVDTMKATVARAVLDAGAAIINDVSALRADAGMAGLVAGARAGVVLMHSRGTVETMARYDLADYGDDPVADVCAELQRAVRHAEDAGIDRDAMVVDPGLGFAKRTEHSLALLRDLRRLADLGLPILVGPSRKRFLGDVARNGHGQEPVSPGLRLEAGLAACVLALVNGARIFRMHDVAPARRALDLAFAVMDSASATAGAR